MAPLALFFSAKGRLAPKAFVIGAIAVYAVSCLSQVLASGPLTARAGLWPFAIVQAVLTWSWFAIHAKRLRDAGRGIGSAPGLPVVDGPAVRPLLLGAAPL